MKNKSFQDLQIQVFQCGTSMDEQIYKQLKTNLFIISNFLSTKLNEIVLITFDNRFNKKFDNKIKIINFVKKPKKNYSKYYKYYKCLKILIY